MTPLWQLKPNRTEREKVIQILRFRSGKNESEESEKGEGKKNKIRKEILKKKRKSEEISNEGELSQRMIRN